MNLIAILEAEQIADHAKGNDELMEGITSDTPLDEIERAVAELRARGEIK